MFILVCAIAGAIILGILFYKDCEDTISGVLLGVLLGAVSGIILTIGISTILQVAVPPTITESTYKLEQHMDTSSYTYYVDAKDSRYAFSYFDENTIIREAGASKVSFTFEGKTGEVKKTERKLGGALDFFFFNFYKTEYDITIPSKEYIRYE